MVGTLSADCQVGGWWVRPLCACHAPIWFAHDIGRSRQQATGCRTHRVAGSPRQAIDAHPFGPPGGVRHVADRSQYLQELMGRDRVLPAAEEFKGQNVTDLLRRGQIAIQFDLVSSITGLYSVCEFEWRILPVPRGLGGRANRMAGGGYGVCTQTKHVYD
jgi:hypothetical protein